MNKIASRLKKGMYGTEFRGASDLFDIRCGQVRSKDFVHNGGWYNEKGEKIGWGDLSPTDIHRISESLQGAEIFVILSESASYWNFQMSPEALGGKTMDAPGIDYVVQHARYVITPGKFYLVTDSGREGFARDGLVLHPLMRSDLAALMST